MLGSFVRRMQCSRTDSRSDCGPNGDDPALGRIEEPIETQIGGGQCLVELGLIQPYLPIRN